MNLKHDDPIMNNYLQDLDNEKTGDKPVFCMKKEANFFDYPSDCWNGPYHFRGFNGVS